jgi:hypothetical protein
LLIFTDRCATLLSRPRAVRAARLKKRRKVGHQGHQRHELGAAAANGACAAYYSYGRFKDVTVVVQTTATATNRTGLLHIK